MFADHSKLDGHFEIFWAPLLGAGDTGNALFAATDIVCALLPLFFIVKINRPIRERVVLFLLMAMGLLACACGLIKTFLVKGVLQSRDPIFEGASVGIWSYSEEYIGITAANIPCLKSLLEAVYHKLGGHITNTTNSSAKYSSSSYGLDSFSPPNQNDYTLTSLNQIYKTNIARVCVEDNPASYHASLEESFLTPKRLETSSESQEYMLVKMKGTGMSGYGLALNPLMDGERGLTTRQVTINGKRVDRYDPRR
ncbi:hypothetical protein E6O75_ATG11121 [Venturia nashicola]|uniref:Rhodopsin domain-containing protein n=1 Tax=Venturia nashicola TaxID=86259 RepID=A0A4Z1P1H6_9PEZI|nr:hypothetical protein E6O75_ATG11121 [Venturia nashicola]